MITKTASIFKDPEDAETLSTIHDKYVVVPADKAPNNIVLICKKHYIDCLKTELGLDSSQGNHTYTATTLSKEEIIDNHMSVLSFFGLSMKDEECDHPLLYCIAYQNYTSVHTNNVISQEMPSVLPSLFLKF